MTWTRELPSTNQDRYPLIRVFRSYKQFSVLKQTEFPNQIQTLQKSTLSVKFCVWRLHAERRVPCLPLLPIHKPKKPWEQPTWLSWRHVPEAPSVIRFQTTTIAPLHCLIGNAIITRCSRLQSVPQALRRNFRRFQYYTVKVAVTLSVNANSIGG